ncbi:DUF3568 family protein [Candidatus Entotheonella palauensis]|uniref:DUF3568 family protein n=1 Tax=Candidatus Entotheonella gemina TaxID=1429439 RepID=W4MFP1_9BACT|nr:DUF3568 family protein [Candidatus Entotheonella palauensis]ETX09000.1 MAG: hypothetical protein ETSY2_02090 [Candidatus Entotheonella gemina]
MRRDAAGRRMGTRRGWAVAVLMSVLLAGCTTVHPRITSGTGTFFWLTQRLVWLYPFPLEEVRTATFSSLAILQYGIDAQQFDGLGGQLVARPVVGQVAYINADPLSPRITKVQVRVPGFTGRQEAERIHATIRSELGM